MKSKSLVDYFEIYDQSFDEVCDELGVIEKPDWKDRWFYRYLLINPVIKYSPIDRFRKAYYSTTDSLKREKLINERYKSKELIFDKKYSSILKGENNWVVVNQLNPFLYNNFEDWWFLSARNILHKTSSVSYENLTTRMGDWLTNTSYESWLDVHSKPLRNIFEKHCFGNYAIFLIPLVGNKKIILSQVNDILNDIHKESEHIIKSKITEKQSKNAFVSLNT